MTSERLKDLEKKFENKKIAIIGDMMLDGYYWGDVSRVSPEAPVPVVEVDEEFFRFGGAANVALNILSLGGTPLPIGVIGNDSDGKMFKSLMQNVKIEDKGIFIDSSRPTTTKTRVIAGKQHVVRIDKESKKIIASETETEISNYLQSIINDIDAIILQDYNKGVLSESLIESTISLANKYNKIVSVDPKFLNFRKYKNATIFKPNKKESEDILGMHIQSDEDISKAGKKLLELINAKYVLLTLGEQGIALFENDNKEIRIPTKAKKVADVSGAGDTVISTITYALSVGATIEESAYLANYAGGLVCEEVGIVPVDKNKLFETIKKNIE